MGAYDLSLGPLLIGSFLSVFFYGVSALQCFNYFWHYHTDKKGVKVLVIVILLIDTLGTIFDIQMCYNYLVTNFGDGTSVQYMNLGITVYPVATSVTAWIVQTFYSWRLAVLTKRKLMPRIIAVLSAIQMLAGIGAAIAGSLIQRLDNLLQTRPVSLVWLYGTFVTDVIITTCFVLFMRRTGFFVRNETIPRLLRAQAGFVTAPFAIGVVICYLAAPSTSLHLAFGLPLSKLYTNSLLSFLNLRDAWSSDLTAGQSNSIQFATQSQSIPLPVLIRTDVHNDANDNNSHSGKGVTHGRDDDSEAGMNESKVTF